jgi:hypothetical protein
MPEALGAVLAVCLVVSPGVALDDRERAAMLVETQTIWQPHGVAVSAGEADTCDRLLQVKSDADARTEDLTHDSALGWVPFVAGRARRVVFLRVSRAESLIGAMSPGTRPEALTRLLVARFLGRILAHELGHVLLNSTRHQPKGLMRAQYRARDVLSAPVSTYTLDAGERALFFAETGKEIRLAHR